MTTYSKNFKFPMPDFNVRPWQQNFYDFVNSVDALLARYILVNNFVGVWQNSTAYTAGQRVVDVVSGLLFTCNVNHISIASPKLMSDDRIANPTFWTSFTFATQYRGAWATATAYATGDMVTFGQKLAIAAAPHTSGVFVTDQTNGLWNVLIDGSAVVALPAGTVANADQIIRYDGVALQYQLSTGVKASSAGILTANGVSITAAGTLSLADATAKANWRAAMGLTAIVLEALGGSVIDDPANVGNLVTQQAVNAQAGAGYAILSTDRNKIVTRTNAGAMADTLVQAGTGNLVSGWSTVVKVLPTSVGSVTITPTTSTIDGLAAIVVRPGIAVRITSDGANYIVEWLSERRDFIKLSHTAASGTAGGATAAATQNQRPLNTKDNDTAGICTLAANQFTLPAGTYDILYVGTIFNPGSRFKSRLRNTTDGTTTIIGLSNTSGVNTSNTSHLAGRFTITASKTFEIDEYTQGAEAVDGLGVAASTGETEIYAFIILLRL